MIDPIDAALWIFYGAAWFIPTVMITYKARRYETMKTKTIQAMSGAGTMYANESLEVDSDGYTVVLNASTSSKYLLSVSPSEEVTVELFEYNDAAAQRPIEDDGGQTLTTVGAGDHAFFDGDVLGHRLAVKIVATAGAANVQLTASGKA